MTDPWLRHPRSSVVGCWYASVAVTSCIDLLTVSHSSTFNKHVGRRRTHRFRLANSWRGRHQYLCAIRGHRERSRLFSIQWRVTGRRLDSRVSNRQVARNWCHADVLNGFGGVRVRCEHSKCGVCGVQDCQNSVNMTTTRSCAPAHDEQKED